IKPVPVPVEAPKVEETEGEEVKQEKPVEKEKKAAEPRDKKNKNLRTGLKDNDKAQAVDTIEELVSVLADVKDDSKEVKGLLVKLLDERLDLRLGRIALYALGELKIKGLFREQLGILQDETNYTYRRELIWAFSKGGVKEIEPVLFKFLPDETPSVRGVIALSLFNLKARNFGFQFLEEAKYEQNSWVKEKYEWVGKKLTN
ncbi:MAG: HEAT repeat domain-containing protein, partial [Candidatus Firestonebacteria bacterium]